MIKPVNTFFVKKDKYYCTRSHFFLQNTHRDREPENYNKNKLLRVVALIKKLESRLKIGGLIAIAAMEQRPPAFAQHVGGGKRDEFAQCARRNFALVIELSDDFLIFRCVEFYFFFFIFVYVRVEKFLLEDNN